MLGVRPWLTAGETGKIEVIYGIWEAIRGGEYWAPVSCSFGLGQMTRSSVYYNGNRVKQASVWGIDERCVCGVTKQGAYRHGRVRMEVMWEHRSVGWLEDCTKAAAGRPQWWVGWERPALRGWWRCSIKLLLLGGILGWESYSLVQCWSWWVFQGSSSECAAHHQFCHRFSYFHWWKQSEMPQLFGWPRIRWRTVCI